ncbi:MAG TPA: hypothetical protein VFD92_10325 [Candidatus Binatia bacterium]|nr:hypothetical protein [Candidatus Binatia bacterium]
MASPFATTSAAGARPTDDDVLRRHGIDGCVRLALAIDADRLAREVDYLPRDAWSGAGRDPVDAS